jgi:hypothetical protein
MPLDRQLRAPKQFETKVPIDRVISLHENVRAHLNPKSWRLGIFTVDPLPVVKVLDRIAKDNTLDGEWVEVPFPEAYMIFDEMA